ncbi:MAG: MBL fold metallo-hydrolase [Clostridia bacterium]|nr:MBL fold metallo-hydrolase [Clostridia bacterium]
MQMNFCPLYSGSSGNASLVMYRDTRILVDCGKSGVQVEEALRFVGEDIADVDAILVTHEHHDHVAGIGVLARRHKIPVYATHETWAAMPSGVGKIPEGLKREFVIGEDFYIKNLGVDSFRISHDAADPCGFRLWGGNHSVSIVTDLGFMSTKVKESVSGSNLILLESNYDPDMLHANEHYRYALKQRIESRRGHLSNADCAQCLIELVETGCSSFILGHLSGENNTPDLAYKTNATQLELEGLHIGKDIRLGMAWRERVGNVYSID